MISLTEEVKVYEIFKAKIAELLQDHLFFEKKDSGFQDEASAFSMDD